MWRLVMWPAVPGLWTVCQVKSRVISMSHILRHGFVTWQGLTDWSTVWEVQEASCVPSERIFKAVWNNLKNRNHLKPSTVEKLLLLDTSGYMEPYPLSSPLLRRHGQEWKISSVIIFVWKPLQIPNDMFLLWLSLIIEWMSGCCGGWTIWTSKEKVIWK